MFPVHFNTAEVKQWWKTDLIFKIYSQKNDQKKVSIFELKIGYLSESVPGCVNDTYLNEYNTRETLCTVLQFTDIVVTLLYIHHSRLWFRLHC